MPDNHTPIKTGWDALPTQHMGTPELIQESVERLAKWGKPKKL